MEFGIFILFIIIIVVYSKQSDLKKDLKKAISDIYKLKEENSFLKKEIESIKYKINPSNSNSQFVSEKDTIQKSIQPKIDNVVNKVPTENSIPINDDVKITSEKITPPIEVIKTPQEETPKNKIESQTKIVDEFKSVENASINVTKEKNAVPNYSIQKETVKTESAFSIFLKKAEKQFADNWTGILGTAIMVLGVGYLSIYTALKVSPFFRILILWLYAGVLIGSYYFLKKKDKWVKTGLWLRSAGASLFLFGCFGASQISSLSFITNPIFGYLLISIGIGLNLYIGYIIKKQSFLSLHVLLSILILCVIPDKLLITFLLASLTATAGIILSYKEKWEYHLLIVIIGFVIFDIWFNAQGTLLTKSENIFAIIGIILVAGSCLFMQYRSVYENTYFDKPAFITHLTNWVLFATGLIFHSTGSRFKTFVLLIGAIICFFIALKARKRKIYWLYNLDGMVSFVLAGLSAIMLNDWNIGIDIIACILYILILTSLFILHKEKEVLLYKIILSINHIVVLALTGMFLLLVTNNIETNNAFHILASSIILFCISVSVTVLSQYKKEYLEVDPFYLNRTISLNSIFGILISIIIILRCNTLYGNSFYYALILITLIWYVLKWRIDTKTFDIGRIVFYFLSITLGLILIKIQGKNYNDWTFGLGLLTVVICNWKQKSFSKNDFYVPFLGITAINILLLIYTYKYLSNFEIAQIFSLFLIGVINHEFLWLSYKKKSIFEDNQSILYGYYYLFVILGSALFLYKSSHFSNITIGLSCLAMLSIELYVLFAKKIRNSLDVTSPKWSKLNLFNTELALFTTIVFGFSCIKIEFVSIYIAALGLVSLLGFNRFEEFKRLHTYSFLLTLLSMFLMIYNAMLFTNNPLVLYLSQFVSFMITVGYTFIYFKNVSKSKENNYSSVLPYLQNITVILLLIIQVETNWLSLFLMLLSILNFLLISRYKVKIGPSLILIIASIAITSSIYYSVIRWEVFTITDWILQLSSVALGIVLMILLDKNEELTLPKSYNHIVINSWLSIIVFSQMEHKWLPIFWAVLAIANLYLSNKKINRVKTISLVYYYLANIHLAFFSFNFYENRFLIHYLSIFILLAIYIYLSYKWKEEFKLKNSLLIYPATLSIGCFLYLTFDKGILTFFWILEALGLLILGIALKEKYFRYVSLSLVGLCVIRLMFFDLSNSNFLIRALVLLGVGVVLLVMNTLFKKYKDRFD